jgi:hypothetical protein
MRVIDYSFGFAVIDALAESWNDVVERGAETWGQYRYEVGSFGDAWPGARLDLARLEASRQSLEDSLSWWESLYGLGRWHGPPCPLDTQRCDYCKSQGLDTCDCPF